MACAGWEFHPRFHPSSCSREHQLHAHLSPKAGKDFLSKSKMGFYKDCGLLGDLRTSNSLSASSKTTTVGFYLPKAILYSTLEK